MAEHKLKENEALEILKTVAADDVPQTMEQASALMLEIDAIDRTSEQLMATAEARMAEIVSEFAPQIMAKQQAGHRMVCALYAFARSKRDELTDNGATKTIKIGASGTVQWRQAPDTIDVIDEDVAIAHCKKVGMLELVKTWTEEALNKEMLKKRPDITGSIPGLAIEKGSEIVTLKTADPLKGLKGKIKKLAKEPGEDQPKPTKKRGKQGAHTAEASLPGKPR